MHKGVLRKHMTRGHTRKYTLGKRAESQAETRLRIVEAAIDLHGTVGPARTTISMIAERAGVQRHTLYAHFPDAWAIGLACSGLSMERNPPPDPDGWRAIAGRDERLRTGLRAIYGWYLENAELLGCVLRDAEHHELTRKISELRFGPVIAGYHAVLGAELNAKQRAMLGLGLSYFTWRTLTREGGLKQAAAVSAMAQAIAAA